MFDDVQDPSRSLSPAPVCDEHLEATRDTLSELSLTLCLPTTKFVGESDPIVIWSPLGGRRCYPGMGWNAFVVELRGAIIELKI